MKKNKVKYIVAPVETTEDIESGYIIQEFVDGEHTYTFVAQGLEEAYKVIAEIGGNGVLIDTKDELAQIKLPI